MLSQCYILVCHPSFVVLHSVWSHFQWEIVSIFNRDISLSLLCLELIGLNPTLAANFCGRVLWWLTNLLRSNFSFLVHFTWEMSQNPFGIVLPRWKVDRTWHEPDTDDQVTESSICNWRLFSEFREVSLLMPGFNIGASSRSVFFKESLSYIWKCWLWCWEVESYMCVEVALCPGNPWASRITCSVAHSVSPAGYLSGSNDHFNPIATIVLS